MIVPRWGSPTTLSKDDMATRRSITRTRTCNRAWTDTRMARAVGIWTKTITRTGWRNPWRRGTRTTIALFALLLGTSGCAGVQKKLVPPPVKTWDEALSAPVLPCNDSADGIKIRIADRGPCVSLAEVDQIVKEAKERTGTQRASLVGAELRIGSFQVRCPSKIIESCTNDTVMVIRRKWWQQYLRHEIGHLLIKRSGLAADGDRLHDYCGFWMRLDGTHCPLMDMLDVDRTQFD